jgi:hypothetical protein
MSATIINHLAAQAGMTTEVRAESGGADATGGCEERFFNEDRKDLKEGFGFTRGPASLQDAAS